MAGMAATLTARRDSPRGRRVLAIAAALVGIVGLLGAAPAAGAGASVPTVTRVPVTPEFFGVQDDQVRPPDPAAWAAGRLWAAWCTIQPTRDVDVVAAAEERLQPAFTTFAESSTRRLTVSLGHPAPWVFDDHRAAARIKPKRVWYCDQSAAVTSFPKSVRFRTEPLGEEYALYVRAVIRAARPYLDADPRNRLVLQAWNEPNLRNGGTVHFKIPGAARTWRQAAASLRRQERIIWQVASVQIPGRFEVTSPALYGKPTHLGEAYLRAQAKSRTIDSVSINFYTLRQRSVNKSLALWLSKARTARRLVTRHPTLKYLPIWVTETNHNLVNGIPDDSNVTGRWAKPRVQKRLMEVTTMEALRLGFAGLQWYQGAPTQTAVNTLPGSPAGDAARVLRYALLGRMLLRCKTVKPVVTCSLSARPGDEPIQVRWSRLGKAGVEILPT